MEFTIQNIVNFIIICKFCACSLNIIKVCYKLKYTYISMLFFKSENLLLNICSTPLLISRLYSIPLKVYHLNNSVALCSKNLSNPFLNLFIC